MARPLRVALTVVPALGVALAALAAAVGGFTVVDRWRLLLMPACFAAVALAERFPVKIGPQQKVNLGALPCLIATLLLPAGIGPATAGVSVLAGNRFVRRSWTESVYNGGNVLVAASVAAMIGTIGSSTDVIPDLRATIAAAAYVLVNLCLGVIPPSLLTGQPYTAVLRKAAAATWPASLTLAASAVTMAVLLVEAPLAAVLPLVALPMIYRMNRAIEAQAEANEQLEAVLASQRRFLTDVSHQVATPLATIMTNLSILRRANHSVAAEGAVADSVAEAERMKRMLARLRSLAHADEDVPLRRELVDLAELTSDVVHAYTAQAATSGVGLVAEVGVAPARVSADKDLLREAVANLVDNAVRVSPRGTLVTLSVTRGSDGPVIAVADQGPGIGSSAATPAAGSGLRSRGGWSSATAARSRSRPRAARGALSRSSCPAR
jgi:signal transduction histidine kinase